MRHHLNKGPTEARLVAVTDIPEYEARGWKINDLFIHVMLGGPVWASVWMWRAA